MAVCITARSPLLQLMNVWKTPQFFAAVSFHVRMSRVQSATLSSGGRSATPSFYFNFYLFIYFILFYLFFFGIVFLYFKKDGATFKRERSRFWCVCVIMYAKVPRKKTMAVQRCKIELSRTENRVGLKFQLEKTMCVAACCMCACLFVCAFLLHLHRDCCTSTTNVSISCTHRISSFFNTTTQNTN